MSIITMGRKWEISTKEDEGNKFCAMMSDDFYYYKRELEEYENQMAEVIAQAREKGII